MIVALACAHIGAVLFYLLALKENLIAPMVHGSKRLPAAHAAAGADAGGQAKAIVLIAVCGLAVWWLVTRR